MSKFMEANEKIAEKVVEGYKRILGNRKKKYAEEILALSEKIMKN